MYLAVNASGSLIRFNEPSTQEDGGVVVGEASEVVEEVVEEREEPMSVRQQVCVTLVFSHLSSTFNHPAFTFKLNTS